MFVTFLVFLQNMTKCHIFCLSCFISILITGNINDIKSLFILHEGYNAFLPPVHAA